MPTNFQIFNFLCHNTFINYQLHYSTSVVKMIIKKCFRKLWTAKDKIVIKFCNLIFASKCFKVKQCGPEFKLINRWPVFYYRQCGPEFKLMNRTPVFYYRGYGMLMKQSIQKVDSSLSNNSILHTKVSRLRLPFYIVGLE